MSRTLINGTGYDVSGGRTLIGGTGYGISGGKTLIGGTGQTISFGTSISSLAVGSSVYMNVNGTRTEFLVIQQGLPSSIYDDSCNGTWLLMKNIYENREWHSSKVNNLENSTIHSYLNGTFLNLFDASIRNIIKQVKIPYRKDGGSGGTDQSGANGLSTKIFLLSGYEVGWTTSDRGHNYSPVDGAVLNYFESGTQTSANNKRIAYLNGSASGWWLRSPSTNQTQHAWDVNLDGSGSYYYTTSTFGIRPALILPSTTKIDANNNIIG